MQRTIIIGLTLLSLILVATLISFWKHSNSTFSEINSTVTTQAETISQNENKIKASVATVEADIEVQAIVLAKLKDSLATNEAQANNQRKLASAYHLATQSQSIYGNTEGGATLGSLLAIESLRQSSTLEGNIALLQAISKVVKDPFVILGNAINEIIFSPDSQLLATSSEDNTVKLWRVANAEEVAHISHTGRINFLSFSNNGKWLATASEDNTAKILNVETGQQINLIHNGAVNHLDFSSDSEHIATTSEDNTIRVWEIVTGNEIVRMKHSSSFTDYQGIGQSELKEVVTFSPDNQFLASAKNDNTARIWDVTSGNEIVRFEYEPIRPFTITYTWHINNVGFSSDGKFLITQGWSPATTDILYEARVWEISTHREITRSRTAIVSPDNQKVILDQGTVQSIQLFPHQKVLWSSVIAGGRRNITFSPDGKLLGFGYWNPRYNNGDAVIIDAITGKELVFLPHDGQVWQVVFSPDNQWVVTHSSGTIGPNYEGGGVRVWDIMTGREIVHLPDSDNMVFSFDGRWLATSGWEGNVHLLPLQQEDLVGYACTHLSRNLTQLEWKMYLGDEPYHTTCVNLPIPEE